MFSSFRNTVEALATGATERPRSPDQNSRRSTDLFSTPSTLADSALTNLRKSLAASPPTGARPDTPPRDARPLPGSGASRGLRLEDRLRASFTVGDASNSTTPGAATPASQPGDPLTTALPKSPELESAPVVNVSRSNTPALGPTASRPSTPARPPSSKPATPAPAEQLATPALSQSVTVRSLVADGDDPLSPIPPSSPAKPASAAPDSPLEADISDVSEALAPRPEIAAAVVAAVEPVADEAPSACASEDATAAPQPEPAPTVSVDPSATEPPAKSAAEAEVESDITATREETALAAVPSPIVEPSDAVVAPEIDLDTPAAVTTIPPTDAAESDVEKLQTRLKLVEQRFSDVSTSFKRLQAEKRAADGLLKELTPLESISDAEGLRDYLKNMSMKLELSTAEIKRLATQQQQHDSRIAELRDTHRLESASQTKLVDGLRVQLEQQASKLAAAAAAAAAASDTSSRQALTVELEKAKSLAKDEEEKRTKAITLLKTVRTKLVKAEKERDEKDREVQAEREARERLGSEIKSHTSDIERVRSEKEKEVRAMREQFEKELASVRERFEREAAARKGQYELEAITTKSTHDQAVAAKTSQIATLENSVRSLTNEKNDMFDQLQQRQGEIESAQAHLEVLQSQTGELQYQLREANDRIAQLVDELADPQQRQSGPMSPLGGGGGGIASEDVARLLREAEGKYEARLGDLRERMRALERERSEAEEEWSRNLAERSREIERLRRLTGEKDGEYEESVRGMREREKRIAELEKVNAAGRRETEQVREDVARLQKLLDARGEVESALNEDAAQLQARLDGLVEQIDEVKSRESQLRATNKTLREELRKVQQSAALLERQRNPGVGYWSGKAPSGSNGALPSDSPTRLTRRGSEATDVVSPPGSPRPSSPALSSKGRDEEDVNLEYLRNVILQFLEHKEMRPNLVRVMSTILRFTPQETRRLIAKV